MKSGFASVVGLLVFILLAGGCGDESDPEDRSREPVEALDDYLDLDPAKASRTWGLPADLLSLDGLERLNARVAADCSRIRARGAVTPVGEASVAAEGGVRWELLETVPAEDTVLVGLHATDKNVAARASLFVPMLPGVLLFGGREQEPFGLSDLAALPPPLPPAEARLWDDNLRRMDQPDGVAGLGRSLRVHVTGDVLVAASRIGAVYDRVEYPDLYGSEPDPTLAWTFVISIADGASGDALSALLARTAPLMGLTLESTTHRGVDYARGVLREKILDYKFVQPAWAVVGDRFVACSYEPRLLQVIDTLKAPEAQPSMAGHVHVRRAIKRAPGGARRVLLADLEALCRVPASAEKGGQPRGWHWDCRNQWVLHEHEPRALVVAHRKTLRAEFEAKHGRGPKGDEWEAIDARLDAFLEAEMARYPEHLEAYRKRLAALDRLRFLAVTYAADGGNWTADWTLDLAD